MASRYENNETKKLNDGRVVYKSKLYPKIPKSDKDIYIVTQTGDRLDTLANQFYENSSLWWIIAAANNVHDAPFALPDGTELRIPMNYVSIMNNFYK
jgi:nucleoid-associated protein YgaU|tara:strand:+ start:6112 stop:6402 length:291 start_codon:yes stop_codon:yes gene_type:complete